MQSLGLSGSVTQQRPVPSVLNSSTEVAGGNAHAWCCNATLQLLGPQAAPVHIFFAGITGGMLTPLKLPELSFIWPASLTCTQPRCHVSPSATIAAIPAWRYACDQQHALSPYDQEMLEGPTRHLLG